jgi:hypothetical protein
MCPLKFSRNGPHKENANLTSSNREDRGRVRRAQEAEAAVPASRMVVQQVKAMIPEAAPVAWFPTHVSEHFKREGVDRAVTRLNSEQPEKDLPGFRRLFWGIELPSVDFFPFAEALADFENEEPLVEITNIQISASAEDVERQRIALNVRSLVTQ